MALADLVRERFWRAVRIDEIGAQLKACDWSGYREFLRHLEEVAADYDPNIFYQLIGHDWSWGLDRATLAALSRHRLRQTQKLLDERNIGPRQHKPDTAPKQRLRVGYVAVGDWPLLLMLRELIALHDRARFEIHGFVGVEMRGNLEWERFADAFDSITVFPQPLSADIIADAHLDILVDIPGFSRGGTPLVAAPRPAPVQCGFIDHMYVGPPPPWIDYRIADRFVIPPEHASDYGVLAYLPDSYMCFDTKRALAERPARAACGLPDDAIVFCAFASGLKITPDAFEIWCSILRDVPGSVLWLRNDEATMNNLRREAAERGIDPARLVAAPFVETFTEHMARHACADLFLDTLHYTAMTTACEALWAGLPVVTRAGETFTARVCGSVLHAAGLPELVTQSGEEYCALAVRLARQPGELAAIRRRVEANRAAAPLFDTARLTRNLEALYARMWARHVAGEPPATLEVEPAPVLRTA